MLVLIALGEIGLLRCGDDLAAGVSPVSLRLLMGRRSQAATGGGGGGASSSSTTSRPLLRALPAAPALETIILPQI